MSLPKVYYNNDKTSFAFSTCQKRWPIILNNCIDDVKHEVARLDASKDALKISQSSKIVEQLGQLHDELTHDKVVKPFNEPAVPGLDSFDKTLQSLPEAEVTWLTGPWLFLECYLYRQINLFFLKQSEWKDFDVFEKLKRDTFKSSQFGVTELLIRYKKLHDELQKKADAVDADLLELLFDEFVDISLWGNATDLSLLANATLEDIKSVQGAELRKKSEKNILTNDLPKLWAQLAGKGKRVDFVLDNAGFENYTDLMLSLFLLDSGILKEIVFHCKTRPWMVSDQMIKDYDILVEDLSNVEWFPEHRVELDFLVQRLKEIKASGELKLVEHEFWTMDLDYWHLPEQQDLYEFLLPSDLIIVKGDLNYRKLTGDRQWPRTTPFTQGIGPLNESKLKLLLLRTCKADVCLGLPEGKNEELCEFWRQQGNEVGELWCSSGKWAVISFTDGNGTHTV